MSFFQNDAHKILNAEFWDPERRALINTLKGLLANDTATGSCHLPPEWWACLWLSDLEFLRELRDDMLHLSKITRYLVGSSFRQGSLRRHVINSWTTRQLYSSSEISTPEQLHEEPLKDDPTALDNQLGNISPTITADQQAETTSCLMPAMSSLSLDQSARSNQEYLCTLRDQNRCVLKFADQVEELAYICPPSMVFSSPFTLFWKVARLFPQDGSKWKMALSEKKQANVCQNMISLAPSAHAYWNKALFALKPLYIANDKKSMVLQFFWLRPQRRNESVSLIEPPLLRFDLDFPDEDVRLLNSETGMMIRSGDKITLRTDDPDNKPLPSWDLLEMQWIIHRLIALSGEAEVEGPEYNDTDERGIDDLDDPDIWGHYYNPADNLIVDSYGDGDDESESVNDGSVAIGQN
ncbi:hypothetical protein AJ79_06154 [Helicocarpus griseus UAMH5409]|uniref:HNH nuclease domain-containing protein n=1 Tax=Helicocarpus griseus UAMH5409 TaxID=1447875 RepID=A0A2B7XF36_9EURO|nr:hypothetical protein AJ79_06154 [Helicocarpus griseus UAMH5409]